MNPISLPICIFHWCRVDAKIWGLFPHGTSQRWPNTQLLQVNICLYSSVNGTGSCIQGWVCLHEGEFREGGVLLYAKFVVYSRVPRQSGQWTAGSRASRCKNKQTNRLTSMKADIQRGEVRGLWWWFISNLAIITKLWQTNLYRLF